MPFPLNPVLKDLANLPAYGVRGIPAPSAAPHRNEPLMSLSCVGHPVDQQLCNQHFENLFTIMM